MVHESLPVQTLKELVAYAKANPGKLSYGSAGVGTSAHLCGELFKHLAGLPDIVHVPYKGANPGLADFYAGHLPMFAASISPQVMEMHRRGKIRILVAGSDRHLEGAPEIPTNVEAGFPDLVTLMFMGVFAPGGTPRPIIDQIAAATHQALADKDFQQEADPGRLRAGDRFRSRADREIRAGRARALDAAAQDRRHQDQLTGASRLRRCDHSLTGCGRSYRRADYPS